MVSVSIVVVTRNRHDALKMSLPLLTEQTRRPEEIIVVDSSDDPLPNRRLVDSLAARSGIPFHFVPSPRGMTLQRNIGLRHVTGDVVVFPDDDSLFFPDALEEFAKVYEADTDGIVVGVQLGNTRENPLHRGPSDGASGRAPIIPEYEKRSLPKLTEKAARLYYRRIEPAVAPSPLRRLKESLIEGVSLPEHFAALGCRLSADQEGYRMSFRTSAIRTRPFNETLTDYAFAEDRDACYGLRDLGIILTSPAPLVHHYQHPAPRHSGFRHGVVEVLNIAYIVCRHTEASSEVRRSIRPWINLRTLVAAGRSSSRYNRDRVRGLFAARRSLPSLLGASASELDKVYTAAMAKLLPGDYQPRAVSHEQASAATMPTSGQRS